MKYVNKVGFLMLVAFTFAIASCDKTKPYETSIPSPEVHFIGAATRIIQVVDDPVPVYNLQVGTTNVSSEDRVVTYNVTSTSAVAGTNYTINTGAPSGTLSIPAGQSIATIAIQPIFAAYPIDSKDTLIFTLSEPSIKPSKFSDTVKIIIKGPSSAACDESNPNITTLIGTYQTDELVDGELNASYETSISSAVLTSPTTAKIGIDGIWDPSWETIYFNLDWSTLPGTAVVVANSAIAGSNAGDLNSAYEGMTIQIRPHSNGQNGTFSFCGPNGPELKLKTQLGVTGLGWFGFVYGLNLAN
ncbi:MAG: hypothetical protein JST10_14025 [Bacteroidetes bacterium]|nr:hypothetical protein [Bacteroidota bacterium]